MRLPGRTRETCTGRPFKVGGHFLRTLRLLSKVVVRCRRPPSLPRTFVASFLSAPLTFLLLLISFGAVGNSVVFAQADVATATVKGIITDETGAGVNEATITLTNNERGAARSVKTDDEGVYRVPLLQPGTYQLRVEAGGFQPLVLSGVVVTVGQIDVRDFTLKVREVNEAVTIKATPTLAETQRSQQSATIEREQIANLPNLSRNFTSYIFTLPGITDVAAARVQQTRVAPTPNSGFSAGGGNGRGNYVSIDGGENDSGVGSLRIRNLSVEAVREFQVLTRLESGLGVSLARMGDWSGEACVHHRRDPEE